MLGAAAVGTPADAEAVQLPRLSGLPWASGVNGSSSKNAAFAAWRGGRALDVRTIFFGIRDWGHMAASGGSVKRGLNGSGRLVVALGMLPRSHAGQLAQCAAGQFDPQMRAIVTSMLNNGAQAAANGGRPVVVRLGWEANNIRGPYPWVAQGDGTTWRDCFRRWVDILNPVEGGVRRKNFLIVWNMANRGDFTYPIGNLWPGNDYVDIVGSQYYDRCPPLADGDRYGFEARLDARTYSNNPAGPRAWLEYAKSKGKKYAVPDWGIGGSRTLCAEPGYDNPYFVQKMYEFFWDNAADIAFEAYFNSVGDGSVVDTHELFEPAPDYPAPSDPGYLGYVQRFNPLAASKYRALWTAAETPEPPPPPPASDTLYWLRYVASYSDLIASIGNDPAAARAHFMATGQAERRQPYFDPEGYMARQPAIADLVGGDQIEATKHYIAKGYARGFYTWANGPQYWLRYIASYDELIPILKTQASAGELHFHNTGQYEGRTVTFDALSYLKANAEVRAVCGDRDQTCATEYYIESKL